VTKYDNVPIINMMQSEDMGDTNPDNTIFRDVLAAIASLDVTKRPSRFMDIHEDIQNTSMNADSSIEIRLNRGESSILIDPTNTLNVKLNAIVDSGASICMFNQRRYFKDMVEDNSTIRTVGKTIKSHGKGTVGYLQNCLYVPELQRNICLTCEPRYAVFFCLL
jgi:hypothetical protein